MRYLICNVFLRSVCVPDFQVVKRFCLKLAQFAQKHLQRRLDILRFSQTNRQSTRSNSLIFDTSNCANIKMKVYGIACLFSFIIARTLADDAQYASVLLDPVSNRLFIENDVFQDAVAWGRFSNQVNKTGYVQFI